MNQNFKLRLKLYNGKEKISLSKRFLRFLADIACHWISITGSFSNLYITVFGGVSHYRWYFCIRFHTLKNRNNYLLFLLRNLSKLVAFKHQDYLILVVFSTENYRIQLFFPQKLEDIPATIFLFDKKNMKSARMLCFQ